MTLKFLGPTPNEQIEELVMVMEHEAQPLPEPMLLAGLSAFPHPNRPRILFAPLATARHPVQALMQRLENACETLGFARADREPIPHVTLARIQGPTPRGPLSELIEQHQQQSWGEIDAASLILFESELHPEGARHTALARVPMGLARTAS